MITEFILLAGGASRRFNGNKLTSEFKGKKLFLYAFDIVSVFKNRDDYMVSVVTSNKEIAEKAEEYGYKVIDAPPPVEGIAASVRAGVNSADANHILCFFVCDQPHFKSDEFLNFTEEFKKSRKSLGRVYSENSFGSPTIFLPAERKRLLELTGDCGGKKLFKNREYETFLFKVPEIYLTDYDIKF